MPKTFAAEIRERLPHVLTNLATMLALIFVLYLIMPVAYVASYVLPGVGIAGGMLVSLGALILALLVELRLHRDFKALAQGFAAYAVARRKRLTAKKKEELRTALANMGEVVSFLILIALIAPVVAIIPGVGVVVVVLPIMCVLIVVLYGWRSWEVARDEFDRAFKRFADSIAKSFEK
jgi:Flp pilus assembly protein TadB